MFPARESKQVSSAHQMNISQQLTVGKSSVPGAANERVEQKEVRFAASREDSESLSLQRMIERG